MAIRKRSRTEEPTPYFGFVEGVTDSLDGNGYSRSFLLLDCMRADRFIDSEDSIRERSSLALVKIMSTPKRISQLFGELAEGDWVWFALADTYHQPYAWELFADDDYLEGRRRSVVGFQRLGPKKTSDALSGEESYSAAYLTRASAWASGRPSVPVSDFAKKYLEPGSIGITILDVGQASAALIERDGAAIGLFDAGAPIWFNKGSLPKPLNAPAIGDGFVFLSHWDFDHFDLGRRHTPYHSLSWFAPNQPVGPNTALFQDSLGSNLTFVHGTASRAGFSLAPGTSKDLKDRNGTGYQLRYDHGPHAVLLTGDADYSVIDPLMKANLDGVTIPHHGGKGTPPPVALGRARAVVSYGSPNAYHHPNADTLKAHTLANWTLSRTANHGAKKRGNRVLFP